MRYKAYRIINEKSKFVIVDEEGYITNRNPSKEELKPLSILPQKDGRSYLKRKQPYNQTNTCPRIKEDTGKPCENPLSPHHAYMERDNDGKETGKWICNVCWGRDYQKNDPNSITNIDGWE